ncbi:LysR family transcriptional regulator [Pseudacidovorax intermedius]|uniref:LysR family transcriptional regulator n=2 Tax=Pseudacidovorax intermedius TaxID=433924 RepID=A0A370FG67_9BURK|nr:LysR family transcriptional regulator [Pseudacidovorax intermedius]RDI22644.1 LysR family transcriptional regulator [Pseudacidovorax intermedius]
MLPDIDSLALFVRAAELRNLTRAAEASHITVPAASRRLTQLEHQFNATLFARHSRGLELTPAGEHLLRLARNVIADVQHMRAEMVNYAAGNFAVLRVHGNTSAMSQFLPGDVARFQGDHAGARIVLEECWSDEAARRVRAGEADVGVVVEGCDVSGLWVRPYRSDRLAAVTREADAPVGETVAFADLLDRDLVGLEGSSTLTRLITAQASAQSRPMALRVQVRSFEAVCRAVQAGLGVGILPLAAAGSFAHALQLKVLPLADDWAVRRMQLCTRAQPAAQTPLDTLLAHLEACAATPQERGG